MPIRMIREGILSSETVCQLSWAEEVFYRRLLNIADDYGLYDARAVILRTRLYPLQLDTVSNRDIEKWHLRCVTLGLVKVYQVDGREYGQVLKFGQQSKGMPKHPIPPGSNPLDYMPENKRAKLPSVTASNPELLRVTASHLNVNENVNVNEDEISSLKKPLSKATLLSACDADENGFPTESPEKGLVDAAMGTGSGKHPKAPCAQSSSVLEGIPTNEEVQGVMQALAIEIFRNPKLLAECADCFIDTFEARGWCDAKGVPVRNWKPAARNFARSYAKNQGSRASTTQPQKRKDSNDPNRYR